MKNVTIDLKRLSYVVSKELVGSTEFNTLKTKVNNLKKKIPETTILIKKKTKVNNLKKKIPDTTILVQKNQYNTDKLNLGKKLGMLIKKYQTLMV